MPQEDVSASGVFLHEAMGKLDENQVLVDISSSSSRILLLTVSENIIKWCKIFLNMVELDTLNSAEGVKAVKVKVDELIRNFQALPSNLLSFDLTTGPLLKIVISNTTTVLYHTILLKFSSLFELKIRNHQEDQITKEQKEYYNEVFHEVTSLSLTLLHKFLERETVSEKLLCTASLYILFSNSLKSLLQSLAFFKRFNKLLSLDPKLGQKLKDEIFKTKDILQHNIDASGKLQTRSARIMQFLKLWLDKLEKRPEIISFFDAFS
ncbi:unnamed protein product [Ambrosiozyma monospora]|uniref:Unnamed protein product n=1 Tax=Ambrosiozyma monospora TaxID=43982 RepID=A0ACB5T089_AMBMO|nr:unnamed protein product [Ambrosiozyma monospora]